MTRLAAVKDQGPVMWRPHRRMQETLKQCISEAGGWRDDSDCETLGIPVRGAGTLPQDNMCFCKKKFEKMEKNNNYFLIVPDSSG